MGQFDLPDDPCYTEGYGKDFFSPNLWPERPARMRPAFETYYRALRGDAEIRCIETCHGPGSPIRYPPVTYGDYLFEKVLGSRISEGAAS